MLTEFFGSPRDSTTYTFVFFKRIADLIVELGKKKVKLSLSQEAAWEDYFLLESKKATDIKTNIETTDRKIDQMVYVLYELMEEEIGIVEG